MTDSHDPRTWHWAYGIPESLQNTEVRMAIKTLNIKHNPDGTVTISAGTYRESVSVGEKTEEQLYEAIKFAIICANFEWTDEMAVFVRSELAKR